MTNHVAGEEDGASLGCNQRPQGCLRFACGGTCWSERAWQCACQTIFDFIFYYIRLFFSVSFMFICLSYCSLKYCYWHDTLFKLKDSCFKTPHNLPSSCVSPLIPFCVIVSSVKESCFTILFSCHPLVRFCFSFFTSIFLNTASFHS